MFGSGKKNKKGPEPEIYKDPPAPEHVSVSALYIILSILYVVGGVLMLIFTSVTVASLGMVLGACMLAYGAARIVIYFTRDNFTGIMQMDLTVGVTLAALGAFMLLHKDFVETVFPFAVSILLLIGAISKIQYSVDLKRMGAQRWKIFLVFALILFVLGGILLYNPFNKEAMCWYIAICLILEGILNIIAVLWISHRIKKNAGSSFRVNPVQAPSSIRSARPGDPGYTSLPGNNEKEVLLEEDTYR